MEKTIPFIKHLPIFLGATTLVFASLSHASGSFGGGSVGNQNQTEYHKGKKVLKKSLKCEGCPLEKVKSAALLLKVWLRLILNCDFVEDFCLFSQAKA